MTNNPQKDCSPFWISLGTYLHDYGVTISLIVVPLLMSVAGALLSDEVARLLCLDEKWRDRIQLLAFVALGVLVIAHIVIAILHVREQKRLTKMEAQLVEERETRELVVSNAKALCDGYLQDLARGPLKFGTEASNTERITLYVHNSEAEFQPIGRFSFNQSYIKQGRSAYPDNAGCIGKAWHHGWCFELLPYSETDDSVWLAACESYGIPEETAHRLNMKSVLYCACTVQNAGSTRPVAVLVVESTKKDRYTEDQMKRILTEDRRTYIARMVEMLRPWLGDTSEAKGKGF